ncbi:MAG: class I SAM-dependent methyltransferase [Pseudomonadota bacterium]
MTEPPAAPLTDRQQREIEFHKDYAAQKAAERLQPVNCDIIEDHERRPHNAYWSTYDRVLAHDWRGKRVLVPGCGFGEDAIRFAHLGAQVSAFDISPDIIEVTKRRIEEFGYPEIDLAVMPCEQIMYTDDTFDLIFFVDILHHVDIANSVAEFKRVLKDGGRIIGNELYTHSALQKNIRESWPVRKVLYPLMTRFIYGQDKPYITEDEHKIDEVEFALLEAVCSNLKTDWFNGFAGRLLPANAKPIAKADRALMRAFGGAGRFWGGRAVFEGTITG